MPNFSIRAFKATGIADATIEEIEAECISLLAADEDLDRPLLLGGYSFGGNVAFEIARQLEAAGRPSPERIVLFDSYAPSAFRGLGDNAEQMAAEVEALARVASADDVDRFAAVWMANVRALQRYRPTTSVASPITLLRAEEQLTDKESTTLGIDVTAASNWREFTDAAVDIVDVPGGHYTIFTDRSHVEAVAQRFSEIFEEQR